MLTSERREKKQGKIRNSEYYGMESIFDTLYAESRNGKTFNHLMEIIESEENIKLAYRTIKRNHGSKTPGVDKKTIRNLAKLCEDEYVRLVKKKFSNYHPRPVRREEIPKDNGKTRPLGIPAISDRIVQQCILQVMEPICEAKFSENSNGFRPNRSAETAIAQCCRLIQVQHLYHVVDLDIKGFFDNINHTKLIRQIWSLGIRDKKLLCIIKQMFEVEIDRRPMTKKTMREYNLFIRSVLNYANDNYGTSLQMPMIKASGRKGKSVDCLHSDEVEALQAALQECSMLEKAIVLCLLNTGVRRGELAGLTWKDVNFREGTIHVSKSLLVFPNYGYQLTTTKESNIRDVDVAPEFMDFLKDYYAQWKAQKKLMGASWQKNLEKKGSKYAQSLLDLRGNDFVICNDYGFPINPDSYGALVRRVGKKAGIEKIHPHMFRHTFVSILLSNPNIGVATVAAEAGHAQPSTTLAIYTQVYDRRRDEIRKQMSRELYK